MIKSWLSYISVRLQIRILITTASRLKGPDPCFKENIFSFKKGPTPSQSWNPIWIYISNVRLHPTIHGSGSQSKLYNKRFKYRILGHTLYIAKRKTTYIYDCFSWRLSLLSFFCILPETLPRVRVNKIPIRVLCKHITREHLSWPNYLLAYKLCVMFCFTSEVTLWTCLFFTPSFSQSPVTMVTFP